MAYFSNISEVKIDDLRKSNLYSEDILKKLEQRDFLSLENIINSSDRNNENFMDPLLYAVKNEFNTYIIFSVLSENLQNDMNLALEVIKEEPELIENTPLSHNKEFMLESASINPEVVKYMSPELEADKGFIVELYKMNNPEITKNLQGNNSIENLVKSNKELLKDKIFFISAVKINAEAIKYAAQELKNDPIFIENVCKSNIGVIGYIANNTDEFNKDSLESAKKLLVDVTANKAIEEAKAENNSIKTLIEEQRSLGVQGEALEALIRRDKQLQRHAKLLENIFMGKIDPVRAARLIDRVCKNLAPEYREQIENVLKLDESIIIKEKNETEVDLEKYGISKDRISRLKSGNREIETIASDGKTVYDKAVLQEDEIGNTMRRNSGVEGPQLYKIAFGATVEEVINELKRLKDENVSAKVYFNGVELDNQNFENLEDGLQFYFKGLKEKSRMPQKENTRSADKKHIDLTQYGYTESQVERLKMATPEELTVASDGVTIYDKAVLEENVIGNSIIRANNLDEPQIFKVKLGSNLVTVAKELIRMQEQGVQVKTYFNGIELDTSKFNSIEEGVAFYHESVKKRAQERENKKVNTEEIEELVSWVRGSEVSRVTEEVRNSMRDRGENNIEQNPDLGDR